MVVYHLHKKTGWETICPNGNLKSHIEIYAQDWRVPFALITPNLPHFTRDTVKSRPTAYNW